MKNIEKLREEKDAIILAHNYQRAEVQDVADYVGDSLGLAMTASKTDASLIVFCGVDFMAETASIVNPDKKVVIPNIHAKCPMAAMIRRDDVRRLKEENKGYEIVAYVNTSAEVKAESDWCCTSSNAINVVKKVSAEGIIFIPDVNLGFYVERFLKDKKLKLWPGFCPTHNHITPEDVVEMKKKYPNAEVIVHPECIPEVIDEAHYVCSTEGMVHRVKKSNAEEFIIGTEVGMIHRLKKESPDKKFYGFHTAVCPNMKSITLERVLNALREEKYEVKVSEEVSLYAYKPIKKMLDMGRGD